MSETNTTKREFAAKRFDDRFAVAVAVRALDSGDTNRTIAARLLPLVEEIIEVQSQNLETARNCLWRLQEHGALSTEYKTPDCPLGAALYYLGEIMTGDAHQNTLIDCIDYLLTAPCGDPDDWEWNRRTALALLDPERSTTDECS